MNPISARKTLSRFFSACAFLGLLAAGSAQAATITVNSFLDNGVNCTLRKAIENANAGGSVHAACTAGTAGGNTIVLGSGTYLFDIAPANGQVAGTPPQFDLVNNNITIQGNGPGNTIVDGQNKDFIFDNFNGTTAITITLSGLTVTRGKSGGPSGFDFGGMYTSADSTLILDNVAFVNNSTTASGAAVYAEGTATINNSTFSGNTSGGEGGAVRAIGKLTLTNSTFNGNSAASGGALYFSGDQVTETLSVTNSTFSGNSATLRGGAIAANNSAAVGTITLTHVTIANNSVSGSGAGTGGGGIFKNQAAAFSIDRSIIANNTAPGGPNCAGSSSFNSLDYNVIGSTSGCTIAGTTANNFVGAVTLNALANNGGPTQTISLPAFSPARDRAPTCATSTDQRGAARPLGPACDSGALEAAPTVSQAPTIGTATPGNAQATITFTAPSNNGGAAITKYTMTSNPGGIIGVGFNTSPIVVSGLTNGTSYTFSVTADNSAGTSLPSGASNAVTPSGPPGAPGIGTATAGNGQASVTFTAPSNNGGSAITGYEVTSSPGGVTASGSSSPLVVVGLTNGVTYTFTVRAANVNGPGPASAASNSVTPGTVPGAPTIGVATAGNAQASVAFTAPASNGGSPITSYTVTSSPGGFTETGAASPIVVAGLANGTAYTFTVRATNGIGQGAASAASNSVTPGAVPGAPSMQGATSGPGLARVFFGPPASDGGSPIVGYTATCGTQSAGGVASPIVVGGLANNAPVTCTVVATNAAGTGAASAASIEVTPHALKLGDLNADGRADVVLRNADGRTAVWLMNGIAAPVSAEVFPAGTAWQVAHIADLDGDGKGDLVWQNPDGRVTVYLMDGTTATLKTNLLPAGGGWTVTRAADLNGDGMSDLVFQNVDGTIAAYLMNGTSVSSGATILGAASGWSVTRTGDFDGDGKADFVWTHADGRVAVWTMNGLGSIATNLILNAGTGWSVALVTDLDGDGKSDLVWSNTDGTTAAWLMNGPVMASGTNVLGAGTGWTVTHAGDFDGDGRSDLVFTHTDGRVAIYLMNGLTATTMTQVLGAGTGWAVKRVADVDGDGRADIVWQHADGRIAVWLMNGTTITSGSDLLGAGSGWSVMP